MGYVKRRIKTKKQKPLRHKALGAFLWVKIFDLTDKKVPAIIKQDIKYWVFFALNCTRRKYGNSTFSKYKG